ncbi:hypothetical protein CTAM01_00329 [Colletotrichum tamarilloi]|uniref:Uncharacterized protein n=1 Tax=Colletotrichum tamarilloi TaxID=1209934 RepID=A0ABQ9RU89_9PEZI|nr:uncharacterized protein CTAM01_00329 [Colletotrichum tamarilloi]KAK1512934.1 hypothetical protein CTAM01_00329 [Colletotrichum tamarilloi]
MGGDDEDNSNNKDPTRIPDDDKPMIDYELPAPPPAAVLAGPSTDMSLSETESEREFPMRQISQNLGRGRRRSRKTRPVRQQQHKHAGSESRGFAVHLGLNLDIEVTLKARIFGDLEISAFDYELRVYTKFAETGVAELDELLSDSKQCCNTAGPMLWVLVLSEHTSTERDGQVQGSSAVYCIFEKEEDKDHRR